MIFKRFIFLILVASLAGCSSMRSLISNEAKTPTEAHEANDSTADEQALEADSMVTTGATQSADEILALALMSQSDLYINSKRNLAPSIKSKVLTVLNEFNAGEFEQSEKSMQQLLATELNLNSAVFVLAGDIALANEKPTDAVSYYRSALKLNDYNAKAANRLAMQMRKEGEFLEAEKLYSQAINAQASHAESYRNRAVLYDLYLNEKAKALQDYQTYSALINYKLALHEHKNTNDPIQTDSANVNTTTLTDTQLTILKSNIKLVKRWLADVGRQVAVLAKIESSKNAGGQ